MRLPRFRPWMPLIAAAVVGLIVSSGITWSRWSRFRRRASDHALLERRALLIADAGEGSAAGARRRAELERRMAAEEKRLPAAGAGGASRSVDPSPVRRAADRDGVARWDRTAAGWAEWSAGHRARASYHARLRRKYERAARYPWLPVPADPPEPR
jgi:hypothetical protein